MLETNTRPISANHKNSMPQLIPLPIETKNKGFFKALWTWASSTREWEFESDWDFSNPDIGGIIVIPKSFRFDGASIPKLLRGFLSPVGLLLVPGIVHDFAYRYDYLWVRQSDGTVVKWGVGSGRKKWDKMFFDVGNQVNGVFVINFIAWFALGLGGWFSWSSNRKRNEADLTPSSIENQK